MFFCFRIDLDYVPWDSPDAAEYGHAEPAVLLRLLELARFKGCKFQFFASNRNLRAFPAGAEAVLNDGHDLDWLCKHPHDAEERFADALALFSMAGHVPQGMAVKTSYPADCPIFDGIDELRFLSAMPGPHPDNLRLFPLETKPLREGLRAGFSARGWCDATKQFIRDSASRNREVTVAVRPQVLGKHDPKLTLVKEILELATAVDYKIMTLREAMALEP